MSTFEFAIFFIASGPERKIADERASGGDAIGVEIAGQLNEQELAR